MNWLINKIMGISSDKLVDTAASGIGAIGTMIDERKFTEEEKSKANANLIAKALEFATLNNDQNSERSKARREVAKKWIGFYLDRLVPGYLGIVAINCFYPQLQSLVVAMKDIIVLMGTGTLMVLGFFFGTHLVRQGTNMFKGK
jgi:hypothetical protein